MSRIVLLLMSFALFSFGDELWSHTQMGRKAYKAGSYEEAYDHFSDAVAADPTNQEARYNKALALAKLNRGEEALPLLKTLSFEDSVKQSDVHYTEAHIAENAADAALAGQDIEKARTSYTTALQKYAQAWAKNPANSDARYNIETTGHKLAKLPPKQEQQDQNQDNQQNQDQKDDKDKKENKEQDKKEDDNKKNDEQEKKDNEKEEDKKEGDKGEQDKEENSQDSTKNQQPQDPQESDGQEEPQPTPQEQAQMEQEQMEALQQIMQYADDAKELNKPPKKKVKPVSNGKEW